MSNSQVGGVYQQIINDVIQSSRVDFEEGAIDEAVLEQLRKVSIVVIVTIITYTTSTYTLVFTCLVIGWRERESVDSKYVALVVMVSPCFPFVFQGQPDSRSAEDGWCELGGFGEGADGTIWGFYSLLPPTTKSPR